ncbi:MAG: hypothetical protein WD512_18490 [Candidatus Paceibacterota bacterium]
MSVSEFFKTFFGVSKQRQDLPTHKIAEAVLAAVLTKKYQDKMDENDDYASYDGSKLPYPSGMSIAHALRTYISHGGNKTEAIEKFIDMYLRTDEQLNKFLDEIVVHNN